MNIFKKDGLVYLLVILGIALLVASPKGFAQAYHSNGNPGDNTSGEVFTAYSTQETLAYSDGVNDRSTNAAVDISWTVSPEYGFSMDRDIQDLNIVTPGDSITYSSYYLTNEGNALVSYTGSYFYSYGGSGASNWTVEVHAGGGAPNVFVPLIEGVISTESKTISDNHDTGMESRYYTVDVNPNAENSPDGAYIDVYTTYETTWTPVGTYTGGNALDYGGTSEADDYFRDQIAAPYLVMDRTSTIDSPNVYVTKGGGAHDPVPGAVITYRIDYSNLGAAGAGSVVVIDRITTKEGEPGTNLAHINAAGTYNDVNLTGSSGDMINGWTISYSTLTAPATTYGATVGWTVIGTSDGSNHFPDGLELYSPASSEYAAKWIKFEKTSVASTEDGVNINWGVTIR